MDTGYKARDHARQRRTLRYQAPTCTLTVCGAPEVAPLRSATTTSKLAACVLVPSCMKATLPLVRSACVKRLTGVRPPASVTNPLRALDTVNVRFWAVSADVNQVLDDHFALHVAVHVGGVGLDLAVAAAALMHENVGGGDVALDIAVHLELTAVANLTLDRGVFPDDQHACVTHGQPPLLAGRPAPFHLSGADAA